MPTYEYACRKCNHRFEQFKPMSAKPARTCPECGGRVDRLLTTGGAVRVRGGRGAGPDLTPCAAGGTCPPDGSCPMRGRH